MTTKPLLIEIGCEELPSTLASRAATCIGQDLHAILSTTFGALPPVTIHATARRIVCLFLDCPEATLPREEKQMGPLVTQAFDDHQQPTPAGLGFAKRCGLKITELPQEESKKGARLYHTITHPANPIAEIIEQALEQCFKQFSGFKTMRWSDSAPAFLRPIRWLFVQHGSTPLPGQALGLDWVPHTYGHRYIAPKALPINHVDDFAHTLEEQGHVILDVQKREVLILSQIAAQKPEGSEVMLNETVLNEVLYLVEYPHTLVGSFDEAFLTLPEAILEAVFHHHQKCFHLTKANKPLPYFVFISHIPSPEPKRIIQDFRRVLHARLADAQFFYTLDQKRSLIEHAKGLSQLTFHHALGSMADKQKRIGKILDGLDLDHLAYAKLIPILKADLCTETVKELPKLQGIIAHHLAKNEGINQDVFVEHLKPRHAQDTLPRDTLSAHLAVADKMDTLVGFFGLGSTPTGDKDPFGLRRLALGVLRIMLAEKMPLSPQRWIEASLAAYGTQTFSKDTTQDLWAFMLERLKHDLPYPHLFQAIEWSIDQPIGVGRQKLGALHAFLKTPNSETLRASHKRIYQLLKGQKTGNTEINPKIWQEEAETTLYEQFLKASKEVTTHLQEEQYDQAWLALDSLNIPITSFFDQVMVLAEDPKIRANRLALLRALHHMLCQLGDLSKIGVER